MRKQLITILLVAFTLSAFAKTPAGIKLLPNDLRSFIPFGAGAPALVEKVSVTDQPFSKALLIITFNKNRKRRLWVKCKHKRTLAQRRCIVDFV